MSVAGLLPLPSILPPSPPREKKMYSSLLIPDTHFSGEPALDSALQSPEQDVRHGASRRGLRPHDLRLSLFLANSGAASAAAAPTLSGG